MPVRFRPSAPLEPQVIRKIILEVLIFKNADFPNKFPNTLKLIVQVNGKVMKRIVLEQLSTLNR